MTFAPFTHGTAEGHCSGGLRRHPVTHARPFARMRAMASVTFRIATVADLPTLSPELSRGQVR